MALLDEYRMALGLWSETRALYAPDTAEVQQVDDSYESHGPEYWKWPPGRLDQWGIATPPSASLKEAQKRVLFAPQP